MNQQTIVITGASRGIGEQLALRYAAEKANLILVARHQEKLREVAESCRQQGATVRFQALDIRDALTLKNFLIEVDNTTPIDIVICNAGVTGSLKPHWQPEDEEQIHEVLTVNIQGTINTVQPLLRSMINRKKGHIVLIGSVAGARGFPQSPAYCASKAAIHMYGESLAAWLSRYQIQVSVVMPGFVKTDMSDQVKSVKPFLISSDKAARIIHRNLKKHKAKIVLPWQVALLTKMAQLVPNKIAHKVLNYFHSYVRTS